MFTNSRFILQKYFRFSCFNCFWGSTVFHPNSQQSLLADTNLQYW